MTNLKAFWILSIFSIVGLTFMWMSQIQFLANVSTDFTEAQIELSRLRADTYVEADNIDTDLLAQNLEFERIDKVHYIDSSLSTALAK
jgi:hypothetical protein